MKLPIIKTLADGLNIVAKNPIILLPLLIVGITDFFSTITEFLPLTIISLVLSIIFYAVTIRMVYDAATKKKVSFENSMNIALNKFFPILGGTIVTTVAILVGLIFLIIPGIFLFVKIFFFEFAILIDQDGVMQSIKRSWKVTKGRWWIVFWFLLITSVPYFTLIIGETLLLPYIPSIALFLFYLLASVISVWYISSLTLAYMRLRK